ncbi:MAG TPA: NlpC/P60 family protein [Pseudogracilibacillus sp.]|nr:NlpC/P60 family protein [Pseudogracilibacillus sp.]
MVTKQSIRKYLAPAAIATSIAVFSPVGMDSAFAHGGPTEAESTTEVESTTSESNQQQETNNRVVFVSQTLSVGDLQQQLLDKGYDINVDGINGPQTESTLRDFQSNQGIAVDGIVGPDTINAINGNSTNNGSSGETSGSDNGAEATTNDSDVISTAQSLVGSPYVMGGTTPSGFDSSGFVNYVFQQHGVDLNRTHADMWANNGTHVDNPQPGDVVFFEGTYKDGVSHSGIYLGNGQMIHAGTEATGVEQTSTEIDYWSDRYIGAKRF